MPSNFLFIAGTVLLSLNFVRLFGLAISDWFYFGAMILALIETTRFDRANFHCWTQNRFIWLAGLILFGAIISTSHAVFMNAAIVEVFQQLYVVTLFISLVWIMVRRGQTNTIVQAFICSGIFAASITVVDYFSGSRFGPMLSGTPDVEFWGRYAGPLGHPNKLGYYIVLTSVLSITKLIEISQIRAQSMVKWFWALLIFVQVFGLYLSGSLTAYLGFSLGTIALLISSKLFRKQASHFLLILLFVGVPLLLLGISVGNLSTPKSLSSETSLILVALDRVGTTTAYSRWFIFEKALQSIDENPLVGAGYDQISTSGIAVDFRQLDGTVHNMLLQNWYVGGLFVFLGWLLVYINLGQMAISAVRLGEKKGVALLILGIATAALCLILMDLFQDAVYQREKWLVFGLLSSWAWTKRQFTK